MTWDVSIRIAHYTDIPFIVIVYHKSCMIFDYINDILLLLLYVMFYSIRCMTHEMSPIYLSI